MNESRSLVVEWAFGIRPCGGLRDLFRTLFFLIGLQAYVWVTLFANKTELMSSRLVRGMCL